MLNQSFLSLFANNKTPLWASTFILLLLVGFFIFRLFKKSEAYWLPKKWALILFVVVSISKILYAIILTSMQFTTWKNGDLMQYSLPPHQPWNYFISYSFTHFFYGTLLGIVSAIVFYLLLKGIIKYREEIFEEGEAELGAIGALIVGWPGAVVYIAFSFVILMALSLFNRFFLKNLYTTITWPLIISLVITFFFHNWFINLLNLSALRI